MDGAYREERFGRRKRGSFVDRRLPGSASGLQVLGGKRGTKDKHEVSF